MKNRYSGDLGVIPLNFNKSTLTFSGKNLKQTAPPNTTYYNEEEFIKMANVSAWQSRKLFELYYHVDVTFMNFPYFCILWSWFFCIWYRIYLCICFWCAVYLLYVIKQHFSSSFRPKPHFSRNTSDKLRLIFDQIFVLCSCWSLFVRFLKYIICIKNFSIFFDLKFRKDNSVLSNEHHNEGKKFAHWPNLHRAIKRVPSEYNIKIVLRFWNLVLWACKTSFSQLMSWNQWKTYSFLVQEVYPF